MTVIKPGVLKTDSGRRTEQESSFIKNGIIVPDKSFLVQNEAGNDFYFGIKDDYKVNGTCTFDRGKVLVFSCTEDGSGSEIGIDDNGVYTEIINNVDLAFSLDYPVKCIHEVKNLCENVFYFNDFNNPDRFLNIDKLDDFKTDDEFDLNKMKLARDYDVSFVNSIQVVNGGGSIEIGLYGFGLELLDNALNVITRTDISAGVPIWYESTTQSYYNITGAFNIENRLDVDGGKPATNKSILVSFTNIDTTFKYYRVIIARKVSGDGVTVEYYRDNNLKSTQESNYTFRGITNGYEPISAQSVVIQPRRYETSRIMTRVGKKLTRWNLKGSVKDYSKLQQSTNNILTEWITDQVISNNAQGKGNSKNTITWFDRRTFMGDEVYAVGVSYLYESGEESPIMHKPGREAEPYDLAELTIKAVPTTANDIELREVRYTGLAENETIERWKVQNTADNTGKLAYYEIDIPYPSTLDCDGVRLFPEGNIRYDKMPDRRLLPIMENAGIPYTSGTVLNNLIGLRFSNIEYPENSGIIAHRFHIAKRSEFDKTVLDTGWMFGYVDESLENTELDFDYHNFRDQDTKWSQNKLTVGFVSPKIFAGNLPSGTHFKLLQTTEKSNEVQSNTSSNLYNSSKELLIKSSIDQYTIVALPDHTNITFSTNVLVHPNSEQPQIGDFAKPLRNVSFSNIVAAYHLLDDTDVYHKNLICSLKNYIIPYRNFQSLEYIPISKFLTLDEDQDIYGGDVFISEFNYMNIYDISAEEFHFFDVNWDVDIECFTDFYTKLWVESDINYDLRVEGTGDQIFYKVNSPVAFNDFILTKVSEERETGEHALKYPIPEYYNFNPDFNIDHLGRTNFLLPSTFNYCSKCSGIYQNHYIWSEDSFPEELFDGFLIFKEENYGIIGENTGQITGVHSEKNRLWVRTERSRFQMVPNPQVMQTDESTAYLGTGDFLSLPESELVKVDYGYAGGQGFLDELNTEFGLVSVDAAAGKIYILGQSIEDISSEQYGNFSFLNEFIPSSDNLRGIQLAYDPQLKRLIVNHKINDWVMSFDLKRKIWISFHSYKHDWIFNNGIYLMSTDNNFIYKHLNKGNHCIFYGTKEDFIIEIQPFAYSTTDLSVLTYYTQSFNNNLQVDYPTFDRMWVYTENKSTGIITLRQQHAQYYNPFAWNTIEATVQYLNSDYSINKIRNLLPSGSEVYTGRVDLKQPININTSLDQQYQNSIRDKLFNIRFYFKPEEDIRLVVDIIQSMKLIINQ